MDLGENIVIAADYWWPWKGFILMYLDGYCIFLEILSRILTKGRRLIVRLPRWISGGR